MSDSVPFIDRRVDRSPYVDQALEKLLKRVRSDHALRALLLADEDGHLVAAQGDLSDELLAGLGSLTAELADRTRGCPLVQPLEQAWVQGPDGVISVRYFTALEARLAVLSLDEEATPEEVFVRVCQGAGRILKLGTEIDTIAAMG